jgi:hypothetical protein
VVQLRLEVYDEAGQKVFDTELRGGNVLDWHLLDGSGERVAPGSYASVLTVKSLTGRLSQRMGVIRVSEKKVVLEVDGHSHLSLAQQQTIGPVEGNGPITILRSSDGEAITAVTHDGTDGQLTSTAGSLTFRTGDVFAGKDKEHMRITEEGRIGVGTNKPEATLDVAGTVRVTEGIRFPDGTTLDASSGKLNVRDAAGQITEDPAAQGTGDLNRLAKWSETGGAGNLTSAAAAEVSGMTIFGQNAASQVAPLFPTAPNYHVVEIGATAGKSPLILAGGNGAMEFWKDLGGGTGAPAAAVAFGMATPGLSATNDMVVSTYISGQAWNERLRLTSAGKVGIGTASPLYPLTVSGRGTLLPFGVAEFSNDYKDSGIILNSKAGPERAWALLSSGTGSGLGVGTFSITDLNANQTRLMINSSGNVGIGTTTLGTSKLTVNGVTDATQFNIGGNRVLGNPGTQNIFAGVEAGLNNTGSFNSFFGFGAGRVNTGNANAFFGTSAGLSNVAGHSNSFFGVDAGRVNTSGNGNSFFGLDAGRNSAGGHSNTFVGREAGKANTSGINNTIIGAFANLAHPDLSNATAIGYNALVSASNTMVLGTSQVTVQVPGTLAVSENFSAANISADNISALNMPGVEFEQFKCFGCAGREVGSGDGSTFDVTLRSVNVPAAGFLFITAHAEFDFTSGDLVAGSNLTATLELVGASTLTAVSGSSNEGKRLTLNLSWMEPVNAAGTVQLKTVSRSFSFNGLAFLYKVRSHGLHVIYVPRRLN